MTTIQSPIAAGMHKIHVPLAAFGSLARGERTPTSDIDVLVTPDAIRPAMHADISIEVVHVA